MGEGKMVFSKPFWEVLVRPVVLPFLALALVDAAMTVYGTTKILGGGPYYSQAAGVVVGLGVLLILLCTFDIWGSWHAVLRESPFITLLLRALWVVAFLYDWATSSWALYEMTGLGATDISGSPADMIRMTMIAVAGLLVCGSTLIVAFMTYNERRESGGAPRM